MSTACGSLKTTTTPPSFGTDDPPDYSIVGGGAEQPNPDAVTSDWIRTACTSAAYRYTSDGHVEVEGKGIPTSSMDSQSWSKVNQWRDLIWAMADKFGVSRALLAGIVATESGGNANAKSSAGALGLMQLMPSTAQWLASPTFPQPGEVDVPQQTILQPAWNLHHGTMLVAHLLSTTPNMVSMLATYNHGSVECGTKAGCSDDLWGLYTNCGYVDKVIANMNFAVDSGYSGPVQVDLGEGGAELKGSSVPSILLGLAAGGLALWAYKKMGKR